MENVIKLIQRGVSQASKTTVQAKGQERKNENAVISGQTGGYDRAAG